MLEGELREGYNKMDRYAKVWSLLTYNYFKYLE